MPISRRARIMLGRGMGYTQTEIGKMMKMGGEKTLGRTTIIKECRSIDDRVPEYDQINHDKELLDTFLDLMLGEEPDENLLFFLGYYLEKKWTDVYGIFGGPRTKLLQEQQGDIEDIAY
tara:strand:- start:247 stop:603 length:357 start_codon:yes stop_codon:yes gene_type:complete